MLLLTSILHKLSKPLQSSLHFGLLSYFKKLYHFSKKKSNQAISYIPGTKSFHKRSRREVIERTGIWLKFFFENSKSFDLETKRNLLPSIRYYGHQLWRTRVFMENVLTVVMPIFIIGGFTTAILSAPHLADVLWYHSGYLVNREELTPKYFSNYFSEATGYIAIMGLPYALLVFLPQRIRALKISWIFPMIGLLWSTFISSLCVIQIYAFFDSIANDLKLLERSENRLLISLAIDARIAAVGIYSVFLFIILGLVIMIFVWKKQVYSTYPDAVIVDELLKILNISERVVKWRNLRNRQQIINKLENIATCIQSDLPQRMRSSDPVINSWQRKVAVEIAAEIRSLKKWVCVPRTDTREQFIKRVNKILTCVATSDWDSLERAKPEKGFQLLQTRITNLGHVSFRALFLPLIFWVFQQTPLALKGQSADYLTMGVFVLASLTFLTEFDPHFGARLSVLKEVVQLLPLPGRDKKP